MCVEKFKIYDDRDAEAVHSKPLPGWAERAKAISESEFEVGVPDVDTSLVRALPDRDKVIRFFDEDSMVVVGWKDSREVLAIIGSSTPLNRELGDLIAEAIREY